MWCRMRVVPTTQRATGLFGKNRGYSSTRISAFGARVWICSNSCSSEGT